MSSMNPGRMITMWGLFSDNDRAGLYPSYYTATTIWNQSIYTKYNIIEIIYGAPFEWYAGMCETYVTYFLVCSTLYSTFIAFQFLIG